jgi:hypothetical protein
MDVHGRAGIPPSKDTHTLQDNTTHRTTAPSQQHTTTAPLVQLWVTSSVRWWTARASTSRIETASLPAYCKIAWGGTPRSISLAPAPLLLPPVPCSCPLFLAPALLLPLLLLLPLAPYSCPCPLLLFLLLLLLLPLLLPMFSPLLLPLAYGFASAPLVTCYEAWFVCVCENFPFFDKHTANCTDCDVRQLRPCRLQL